MEIRRIKINDINISKYNPRKDLKPQDPEYQKIKRSLDKWGLIEPLILNIRNNTLVGGHQRIKILKARGDIEVEVSIVDLDDQNEQALNIALNKTSGEWDEDKLQELLSSMTLETLALTGFDPEDVKLPGLGEDDFQLEDFLFDDIQIPCWFVLRADITEYELLREQITSLKAKGLKIEDSQDGEYE